MSKIPIMIAGQPAGHGGHFEKGELDHLSERGVSIWNNDATLHLGTDIARDFCARARQLSNIVPIQPWDPAWRQAPATIETMRTLLGATLEKGKLYYFPTTFDEPATNLPKKLRAELETAKAGGDLLRIEFAEQAIREWRIANYAKAKDHYRTMKPFLPIPYIVSMPFPVPDIADEDCIIPDAGAWPLSLIEKHFHKIGHLMNRCEEQMAYLTDADFPMTVKQALQVGPRMRAVSVTDGLIISDLSILKEHLFDPVKRVVTPILDGIIKGCL